MTAARWIFGYGSLVWRPAFAWADRRPGTIAGWSRRFWQWSTDHRGVPEAPGRVVTLVADADARCHGMAYRVDPPHVQEVLDRLDVREKGGYVRLEVEVDVGGGERVDAVTYVATAGNPNYAGPASLAEIAAVVRRARGPSGPNDEYVLRLAEALRTQGADDPHVFALEALVLGGDRT